MWNVVIENRTHIEDNGAMEVRSAAVEIYGVPSCVMKSCILALIRPVLVMLHDTLFHQNRRL